MPDAPVDAETLKAALRRGVAAREPLMQGTEPTTTALRLMHGTADGVPGLFVDLYDRWLVAHLFADRLMASEGTVVAALADLGYEGVYIKRHPRQANEIRDPRDPAYAPAEPVHGSAAPRDLTVREYGMPLWVRLGDGLRTGLFLDQRDNRRLVRQTAGGLRVLNLFSYTGGFSVAALAGGASEVVSVDVSKAALAWGDRSVQGVGPGEHLSVHDDAFHVLERFARQGRRFELVVVDPPSYATTKKRRFRVTKDYVALAEAALGVLARGGHLLACANHTEIGSGRLRRFVDDAARAAGCGLGAVRDLGAGTDFPDDRGEPVPRSLIAQVSKTLEK